MSILTVITHPNPLLKKTSKKVENIDSDLQKFMDDMLDTMYADKGVGLAAVQVGQLKRILVMDVDYKIESCGGGHSHHSHDDHIKNKKPIFLVNAEIIKVSKEISTYQEGCLSFPEIRADVKRPKKVTVKYLDYYGKEQVLEADDLTATCIQHEIDHLDGITFLDHLSGLKRQIALRKFKKLNNGKI